MKKFESFIQKFSWLLKLGIGALFIFWATQLGTMIYDSFTNEYNNPKKRDFEYERNFTIESSKLFDELTKKARSSKIYSPEQHYKGLVEIEKKHFALRTKYNFQPAEYLLQLNELTKIYQNSCIKNKISEKERRIGSDIYKNWRENGGAIIDDLKTKEKNDNRPWIVKTKENLNSFLNWFIIFFFRGLPLALLFYLIRMTDRKGILETILADKKKFFLSILAWPFCIFKYPFNVIKEIRVEAELRRLGGLFRKLTEHERQLIKEVAASKNYKSWISSFRFINAEQLKRSLAVAMLATILVSIIPGHAHSGQCSKEIKEISSLDLYFDDVGDEDHQKESPSDIDALPETGFFPKYFFEPLRHEFNYRREFQNGIPRQIENIPNGCLVITSVYHLSYR